MILVRKGKIQMVLLYIFADISCSIVEFFSMANFTNPGILGTIENFRRVFQSPILNGREPDADEKTREKGQIAQVRSIFCDH